MTDKGSIDLDRSDAILIWLALEHDTAGEPYGAIHEHAEAIKMRLEAAFDIDPNAALRASVEATPLDAFREALKVLAHGETP